MKKIAVLAALAILVAASLLSAGFWWGNKSAASPSMQAVKTFQAGWVNIPWIGPTMPIDPAVANALPNVAAIYYYDNSTGTWLRYFPGRPEISNLTTLTFGESYLVLLTAPVTVPWIPEDLIYDILPTICALSIGSLEMDEVCDIIDDLVNTLAPTATATATPTSTAPIVFRGTVVGAPTQECPYLQLEGDCWWSVDVMIDEVVKMEQSEAFLYDYEEREIVTIILPEVGAAAPDVSVGDSVEVSGQESMWSCGYLCDAWGLTVWPSLFEDNYIQRL
jgi:hypothetical protein